MLHERWLLGSSDNFVDENSPDRVNKVTASMRRCNKQPEVFDLNKYVSALDLHQKAYAVFQSKWYIYSYVLTVLLIAWRRDVWG